MIVTVTLNPAIDRTLVVKNLVTGGLNRTVYSRLDAGGKGINVSKAISALGGESIACGVLGGKNGRYIRDTLTSMGIQHDFVEVPGETRTNIKIVTEAGVHTDINEPGSGVTESDFRRFTDRLNGYIRRGNMIVISGRVPPNLPVELYAGLCKSVTEANIPLIVDADGAFLRAALPARPEIVKPNVTELEQATGEKIDSPEAALRGARMLMEGGARMVAASLGEMGAVFVSRTRAVFVQAPAVQAVGPVGAGDAMVGALALAMEQKMRFEQAARYAVAAGTASITMPGTRMAPLKTVLEIYEKVKAVNL